MPFLMPSPATSQVLPCIWAPRNDYGPVKNCPNGDWSWTPWDLKIWHTEPGIVCSSHAHAVYIYIYTFIYLFVWLLIFKYIHTGQTWVHPWQQPSHQSNLVHSCTPTMIWGINHFDSSFASVASTDLQSDPVQSSKRWVPSQLFITQKKHHPFDP